MMPTILCLLAMFGLTFFFKESDLFNPIRIKLIQLHPILAQLLSCPFCVGFYSGLIVFGLANFPDYHNQWFHLPIWGLSGASISLLLSLLVSRLER